MPQIQSDPLYKVLRDFHKLTGARIELLDAELHTLLHYPPEKIPFCRQIAADASLGQKCAECDRYNSQISARSKRAVHYRCHMGLMEAVAPITDGNDILAYVMFGQVLMQENAGETRAVLKRRFPEAKYPGVTQAIDRIPVKSASELAASVTILQSLIAYMLSNRWIVPERSEFIRRLDDYIGANLTRSITVDEICAAFRIGRTRLYGAAETYLGCSVAQYVRRQRIAHACRLLRETEQSVTAIAYAVGFSDYRHFSRVFRAVQGCSATAYRAGKR